MTDKLYEFIVNKRKGLSVDTYTMSIGSLINLYKDDEIIVDLNKNDSSINIANTFEMIVRDLPLMYNFLVEQQQDGRWKVVYSNRMLRDILFFTEVHEGKWLGFYSDDIEEDLRWANFHPRVKMMIKQYKLNFIIMKRN